MLESSAAAACPRTRHQSRADLKFRGPFPSKRAAVPVLNLADDRPPVESHTLLSRSLENDG